MINCRGTSKQLSVSLKRKNQDNSHILRNFHRPCQIHGSFHMGCEISHILRTHFAHPAKIKTPCEIISNTLRNFRRLCENFRRPNTISHVVRNHFSHPKPFCTLCENERSPCSPFLNPKPQLLHFANTKHPTNPLFFFATLQPCPSPFDISPRSSHFEDSPLLSADPRLIFHFRHGTDQKSPSHPFTETHSKVESLLYSGA